MLVGVDGSKHTTSAHQWIKVFHVANSDGVVVAIAHDFVLNLFPAFKGALKHHLTIEHHRNRGERTGRGLSMRWKDVRKMSDCVCVIKAGWGTKAE